MYEVVHQGLRGRQLGLVALQLWTYMNLRPYSQIIMSDKICEEEEGGFAAPVKACLNYSAGCKDALLASV